MKLKSTGKNATRIFLITTGALSAAFVGGTIAAAWLLVRPNKRTPDCIPRIRYGRIEPQTLISADGVRLHAWVQYSRFADPNDWVLVLHGYRSDRTIQHYRRRFFARRGYNVVLLHFRGHGSSDSARISYGYHEAKDVEAAFNFIRSLRPGSNVRIGIDGISMGAAAAAYAVGNGNIDPDWMILESCYDNIRNALKNRLALRVGSSLTPILAWPIEVVVEYLVRLRADDLDPAKALEKAHCPILLLSGDSELVLKPVEIEYLYGCIPNPKRCVLFPGAGHEDFLVHDPRRYAKAVGSFLRDFSPHVDREDSTPVLGLARE
ncbi:MAG TPA: alpha/beta fold hydrolase [Acidobacteriota bacterium]|nr:alpha/beta fold hydrolase [Acidobacteriota bacterium]